MLDSGKQPQKLTKFPYMAQVVKMYTLQVTFRSDTHLLYNSE